MAIAKLTDTWMRKAQKPGTYWDGSRKGLGVRVSPKGTKTWIYQKSGANFQTLGRWPTLVVPEAHTKHRILEAEHDPHREPRAPIPTLREAGEGKKKYLAQRGRAQRTIDGVDEILKRYCPHWLDRQLDRITGEALVALHEKIGERTQVSANLLMRNLRSIHNDARRKCSQLGDWPGRGRVKFYKEKRRDTIVRDLSKWHGALATEVSNPRKRDLWSFALLTGLRNEDACTLRWDELEERNGVMWAYRPDPKGGPEKAFWLPLCSQARAIVERQPKVCDWVWWTNAGRGRLPVKPKDADARTTRRHERGFTHWGALRKPRRPPGDSWGRKQPKKCAEWKSSLPMAHDLRRTWATAAVEAGVAYPVYQRLLNHSSDNVTLGYIKPTEDMLARGAQAAGDLISSRTGPF